MQSMLLLRNFDRVNSVWYLYQILGLYLILPVMARGLRGLSPRDAAVPIAIAFVFFFVQPTVRVAAATLGTDELAGVVGAGFTGGTYGVYLLLASWGLAFLVSRVPKVDKPPLYMRQCQANEPPADSLRRT